MSKQRIVVIEDEPDILEILTYNLKREGFSVKACLDGAKGLTLIQQQLPDLVLLDIMLPGLSGLEICRSLKNNPLTQHICVIMVTAKGSESDVVTGLELGADDYVSKPFSPKELVARVSAVLRRASAETQGSTERIEHNGLIIDLDSRQVSYNCKNIELTATEFRLLHRLASRPKRVFTREQLIDQSFASDAEVVDRNIDVHIRAIRKKIGEDQQIIETVRGVGYRFNLNSEQESGI